MNDVISLRIQKKEKTSSAIPEGTEQTEPVFFSVIRSNVIIAIMEEAPSESCCNEFQDSFNMRPRKFNRLRT